MGPPPSSLSSPPAPSLLGPASGWLRSLFWTMIVLGQAALVYMLVFAHAMPGNSNSLLFSTTSGTTATLGQAADPAQLQKLRGRRHSIHDLHAADRDEGSGDSSLQPHAYYGPLGIPVGQPPNLPRLPEGRDSATSAAASPGEAEAAAEAAEADRGIYGGKGDGKHLGGFTDFDPQGVSPGVWANMLTEFGVKSVLDVGCGRGISSRWFLEHNARVLCVEGSHDAVNRSFLPSDAIVEHDYSRGPWWPRDTYDAAWSVEFLEHVSRQYMPNYMQTLKKAAVIFVTSSRWGGWHHVEIHNDEWWTRKFASHGFLYDEKLTDRVRGWAKREQGGPYVLPTGNKPAPQHVATSMKVFLNPAVASLPAHGHLFPQHGCAGRRQETNGKEAEGVKVVAPGIWHEPRECGTGPNGHRETPLPDSFLPLPVRPEMHKRWVEALRAGINLPPA